LKLKLEEFMANPNDSKISNDLKPAVVYYALKDLEDLPTLEKYFQL